MKKRLIVGVVLLAAVPAGCSEASQATEIRAVVAPDFAHEGLVAGDPVGEATLRLYEEETVVLETVLNAEGTALITPDPGTYDVQISGSGEDTDCFWGETVFGVAFPSSPLTIEVAYICPGQ